MTSLFAKLFGMMFLFSPVTYVDNIDFDVAPPPIEKNIETSVTAKSYFVYDLVASGVIAEKDANIKRPIASLTKLMTALLIFENHAPDEVVKVTADMQNIEPVKMWLLENEKITVSDLMSALLIASANDAALALSIYDAGNIDEFVRKMNARAITLGFSNTQFQNPHGLDQIDHFSTAREIGLLAAFLINRKDNQWGDFFTETVATKEKAVSSMDGETEHKFENSNDLLWSDLPIYGVKTGTTDNAGQCLVALFKKDHKEILVVILGSEDRYGDAKKILSYFMN